MQAILTENDKLIRDYPFKLNRDYAAVLEAWFSSPPLNEKFEYTEEGHRIFWAYLAYIGFTAYLISEIGTKETLTDAEIQSFVFIIGERIGFTLQVGAILSDGYSSKEQE